MSAPSGADGLADAGSNSGYLAAADSAEAELRERGSRFLALLVPVGGEEAAGATLEEIRRLHRGATHHCWAWRLGPLARERSSDDGEPAGTAGEPILRVLRGAALSDVLVVVVRWFGGVKLGKGGLARAYSGACGLVLERTATVRRIETILLRVSLPYERLGAVKRLAEAPGRRLRSESYGEEVVMEIEVELPALLEFESALADLGPRSVVERMSTSE
jgi:uncharacterized YigZ family protein